MTMAKPGGGRGARPLDAVLAAWFLSLAFDLFLHAGLLARLYARTSEFLLPAEEAFRRIPLGYLAFLLLTLALYWLFGRLDVRRAAQGFRLGLAVGMVLWAIWVLGLYSIARVEADLLLGWWLGQAVELGLAGSVLGAAAAGVTRKRLYLRVAAAMGGLVVVTLALQVAGWAPPMKTLGTP